MRKIVLRIAAEIALLAASAIDAVRMWYSRRD